MSAPAQPVTSGQVRSNASRYVFLSSFTFLSALTLRDLFSIVWESFMSPDENKKYPRVIGMQVALFLVVYIMTLIMAMYWPYFSNPDGSFNV